MIFTLQEHVLMGIKLHVASLVTLHKVWLTACNS